MRSILEEFWYGNIFPNTDCRIKGEEVKELMVIPPINSFFAKKNIAFFRSVCYNSCKTLYSFERELL